MGDKLDEDTLTYEKVQCIIDEQLAHIEELEEKEEATETKNPVPAQAVPKSRVKSFFNSIKKLLHFRQNNQ